MEANMREKDLWRCIMNWKVAGKDKSTYTFAH
jgi:hypothetical protein